MAGQAPYYDANGVLHPGTPDPEGQAPDLWAVAGATQADRAAAAAAPQWTTNPTPPAYTPPTATTPAPGGPLSAYQQDAVAYLQALLEDYGLGSMATWAYEQVVAGNSPEMVMQLLRERPEYRQRFHVIFERQKRGLSAISPAEVIAYERQARQLMMRSGLPPGFYDSTDDFNAFLIGDVSLAELNDRIEGARVAIYQTDPTVRDEMVNLYGEGGLMAHWLDPAKALPVLQKRRAAAESSAAGVRSGFGRLSRDEAERMYDLDIDQREAEQGFATLVSSRELFSSLPGENTDEIDRRAQLGAAFGGDALARERIERRAAARKAVFGGGGGYAESKTGFGGLGSAQS